MTSRKIVNDWIYNKLNSIDGMTGKVARVIPFYLEASGVKYPLVTYAFQDFRDLYHGVGTYVACEAVIAVKVWDKNKGFDSIDNLLENIESVVFDSVGEEYGGSVIEYVERESMSDDFEGADGNFFCCGMLIIRVGLKWHR